MREMEQKPSSRAKKRILLLGLVLISIAGYRYWSGGSAQTGPGKRSPFAPKLLSKEEIRDQIREASKNDLYRFRLNEVRLPRFEEPVILEYSFDPEIQEMAEDLLSRYKPDLGVMIAMDASTGRILAMAGENRVFALEGNPALEATYPSASVFKVVTAAAAIEEQKANPHTLIAFSGRNHTLYKSQVLSERLGGWMRRISLKDAFAKSINTVFGRLAVFEIGKAPLKSFSSRFAYGEPIPAEFPIAVSRAANPSNLFELAEMASGYTQDNVMSPVHGAMIAAAVANDGVMMQPYFLNAAYLKSGEAIYRAEPTVQNQVMTAGTAKEVRTLMRETVTSGTSRKSFRGFFRGRYSSVEIGGKTGHLTDRSLGGSIDWFVGYGESHGRKISVSVLTMHKKFWTVKSAYLARRTFETAFSPKPVAKNE